MISFWRNDEQRRIRERAEHLLAKTYPDVRWLWIVGDSTDRTADMLRAYDAPTVLEMQTDVLGTDMEQRCRRLSLTLTYAFQHVDTTDDLVMIHESDLFSATDVLERLLRHDKLPIAGWPVLHFDGSVLFYDIWAYHKDGQQFTNHAPYHPAFQSDAPFEVDGFGSVALMHAEDVRGQAIETEAFRELCRVLRSKGRILWVDPTEVIEQPADLWP